MKNDMAITGLTRIAFGFIFLWAFLDKLLGLSFSTKPENAWILGKSPTFSYLKFATAGPLSAFYRSLAENSLIDWIFMLSLLLLGIAFLFGIAGKLAFFGGALFMVVIYSSNSLPKNNPFLYEHLIYALVFILLYTIRTDDIIGFGKQWKNTALVKKLSFLS
jgi:thiosulfate dehydrogenase [quinone] large subunit